MLVTDDSSMNIMLPLELRRGRLRPDRLAFYFSVEITTTTVSYTHAVTACVPFKVTWTTHCLYIATYAIQSFHCYRSVHGWYNNCSMQMAIILKIEIRRSHVIHGGLPRLKH